MRKYIEPSLQKCKCVDCNRMRILFVVRTLGYGGASKQLALLADALSKYDNEIFIYSYNADKTAQSLSSDVTFIPELKVSRNKFEEYLFSIFKIRKKIREIKPHVIISWRSNAGCFSRLASIGLNVKTVFCDRTDPYTETSIALKISAFICGFSYGGVFQLEKVRKYYKRLYEKSIVIHNPIDSDMKNHNLIPYKERSKKIVHVGRFVLVQKRQDVMLDAFKVFLERNSDYTLHFYGDGCDYDYVKKLAIEKGVSNSVVFHGAVRNIPEVIKDARMLVLTSDYEGIPNVILEAFAAAVPVISTDCSPGGARFLIGDNEIGLLTPLGDAEEIAKQMQRIADDCDLAEVYISKGLIKLNDFSPEKIFAKWNEYLRNLMW